MDFGSQARPRFGHRSPALSIGGIMNTATTQASIRREPELLGQTVVLIGGSAGIGFETARRAQAEGANVILTGRNPQPLHRSARPPAALSKSAFVPRHPAAFACQLRAHLRA